jgi:hypothetical protein
MRPKLGRSLPRARLRDSAGLPASQRSVPTTLHPTAGFIPDIARGAEPGPLSAAERELLRALGRRVREIAELPCQAERRARWLAHGSLVKVPPMLLVFPEDSWVEIIGEEDLRLRDPFWRQWEWFLRHLVWRHEHLADDFVVELVLAIGLTLRRGGWGMEARYTKAGTKGSYVWDAPIKHLDDMARLRYPTIEPDQAGTARAAEALADALHDILPVAVQCPVPGANLVGEATMLRGLEQVLLDMYDNPEFLHRLMEFLGRGLAADLDLLERRGLLTANSANQYTDSGGIGYTRDLPPAEPAAAGSTASGAAVRLSQLWGHGVAQEFSGVSPSQHEEFLLEHQLPILERFGLVAYGCCEPYTDKFDMLARRVKRLRRVSVSPWCDIHRAAEALGNRAIFSWKPSPAMLADVFHPDQVRQYIRETLEKTKGCWMEIILKDTFTISGDPGRVEQWARIARQEIARAAG